MCAYRRFDIVGKKTVNLLPPVEPVPVNHGRYALWEYNGKIYEYWEASARYEADRADWLASQSAKADVIKGNP